MRTFCFIFIPLLFFHMSSASQQGNAQVTQATGSIHGRVLDAAGDAPLPGANILLLTTHTGTAADAEGRYKLEQVPVGSWSLRVTFMGYEAVVLTDIIVRPGRITFVDARLISATYETAEIEVTAGYFRVRESAPVSVATFSGEEIRRSPGSAGDVSRIMMVLPSIAKVNDQSNSLIVRGGSPLENAFYLDGIEIPNINHFPAQGSSGGPIGMLPVDMIADVTFMAGGFPVRFGDKLSSVMDIRLRDGNSERVDAQLDLNFAGFGGLVEGPLGGSGTWMLSARRSYFDLLIKTVNIGSSVAPWYGDALAKVHIQPASKHRITLLALFSDDHNNPDAQAAVDNDMQYYGPQDIYNGTAGLHWRALWNDRLFSSTTISYTSMRFLEEFSKTGSNQPVYSNDSHEQWLSLRSTNTFRLLETITLESGFDAKLLFHRYNNRYAPIPDALGNRQSELIIDESVSSALLGLHASITTTPLPRLTCTFGLRADHASVNDNTNLSPRLALAYRLTDRTTVSASIGLYTQSLPLLLMAGERGDGAPAVPRSTHTILGISQLLDESAMLTLEGYYKKGSRFPMNPSQPSLFLMDEMSYRYGFFSAHTGLVDAGASLSYGAEIIVQKKLARDIYGFASASWSHAGYTGLDGASYSRVHDNRLQFSVEGGYKPDSYWEFSLRWLYAGGIPFTPFDLDASRIHDTEVLDANRINSERHPAYHSMNLRVDRRFYFASSNLVVYISVWNVYNRKNVAAYIWDTVKKEPKRLYQWGLLPIFGIEYEL